LIYHVFQIGTFGTEITTRPSPIATALFATFSSSFPIALYIFLCGIIGIVATTLLTDYTGKDTSGRISRSLTGEAARRHIRAFRRPSWRRSSAGISNCLFWSVAAGCGHDPR
jgi:hypothetical protein